MEEFFFTVDKSEGERLDTYLTNAMNVTRSYVKMLIGDSHIFLNGKVVKSGKTVKTGDEIFVQTPEVVTSIQPENIPLEIIYEDNDIAVINKQQGLIVHPASGHYTGTLVNGLLYHLKSLSAINGVIRPGIVHRLDKDTSGVMVVAKNDKAHLSLSEQIASRSVTKIYHALLEGNLTDNEGVIQTLIGRSEKDRKIMAVTDEGREAITKYKVLTRFKENCLTEFQILTGRTHQIRVHSKFIGHPVVGDLTYGFKRQHFNLEGQLLHAYSLTFIHPSTNKEMTFRAIPPDYFIKVYNTLCRENSIEGGLYET